MFFTINSNSTSFQHFQKTYYIKTIFIIRWGLADRNSILLKVFCLINYFSHWHPEIKRIISYLEDDLSIFDYFNLNDIIEL